MCAAYELSLRKADAAMIEVEEISDSGPRKGEKRMKTIALAGNPNCGKTTLFNQLTGARQYTGNWPGVTVEKKEGPLRNDSSIRLQDLPGIYSHFPLQSGRSRLAKLPASGKAGSCF